MDRQDWRTRPSPIAPSAVTRDQDVIEVLLAAGAGLEGRTRGSRTRFRVI